MINRILIFGFSLFVLAGCAGTNKVVMAPEYEQRMLDTLVVTAPKKAQKYELPVYQATAERTHDLIHTSLDVSFDWGKQHLLGKAALTLKPYFYTTNELVLDAKGFDLHSIKMNGKDLKYEYNGAKIKIDLGRPFKSTEEYTININYTAKPNDLEAGGSAAITSDKGLYFINPLGEDPDKPKQIWTQGETESSSCWFPTIDKPNERCTQEIKITVTDNFETLSNGTLKSSKKNADGTRTDYWAMDEAHAPYLFMMAIGEFAVVEDSWKGVPLGYYVEPAYKADAKEIFNHTPEMMTFYSDLLGYQYPWDKYSQVIVRDYVSGAMENTTAVIFGDFVQKDKRELIDNHNDRIVAHEMFHHWFGDLVTCESWSNLPMNESFANYGEYLWYEYKYGKDAAESHRKNEIAGYMSQANRGSIHPLIDFGYADKEDMFDGHSYNKGGAILHMLRDYIGDEAFFATFQKYLQDNQFKAAEAHHLRLAAESVTGRDLNWFFNQWFFDQGHPDLEYKYNYDPSGKLNLTVSQLQNPDTHVPVYQLPLKVDIYTSKGKERKELWVNARKQTFEIPVSEPPKLVNVDPNYVILCTAKDRSKTDEEYVYQYYNAKEFRDRIDALEKLKTNKSAAATKLFVDALDDPYWKIRSNAIAGLSPGNEVALNKLATTDKHSKVKAAALEKLAESGQSSYISTFTKAVESNTEAYRVVSSGLKGLHKLDSKKALSYTQKLEKSDNTTILNSIGDIYAGTGDTKYLSYFEGVWSKFDGFAVFDFFGNYSSLLNRASPSDAKVSCNKLNTVATDYKGSPWKRYAATRTINNLKVELMNQLSETSGEGQKLELETRIGSLQGMIDKIKAQETNARLIGMYSNF